MNRGYSAGQGAGYLNYMNLAPGYKVGDTAPFLRVLSADDAIQGNRPPEFLGRPAPPPTAEQLHQWRESDALMDRVYQRAQREGLTTPYPSIDILLGPYLP